MGTIFEKHLTMFFTEIIGEMLINAMNLNSMNELEQEWKEAIKEFNEKKTTGEVYRIYAKKRN